MTERRAFSARLPEETHRQIEKLAARLGTKTGVVIIAVRELYEREVQYPARWTRTDADEQRPAGREEGQDDE